MRKFFVTTPIYYVNDVPHIGHAYTTIAADAIARYKRMQGFNVFFLTGTDEHGQKIEKAALTQGLTPQDLADKTVVKFQELWKVLDISNDDFIRTTEERHVKVVQAFFREMFKKGDIYLGEYEGWYCIFDEAFFPETQLVNGNCPSCGRPPTKLKEESYFFRLSKYQERLLRYMEEHPDFVEPPSRRNEVVSFVEEGLQDLSISRSTFKWGIPVPGDDRHVIYVWFDALINYITAAGYLLDGEKFKRYWPADIHIIGKEILRFHAIIWPTMLMSLGIEPPRKVFAHGWWTVEGEKMSKSKGNVVDPHQVVAEFGVDALRYFLLREVPFGNDADYSKQAFINRFNSDLANDLGNLLHRTLPMVEQYYQGIVPEPGDSSEDEELKSFALNTLPSLEEHMNRLDFCSALIRIWDLVKRVNKYIDESAPWSLARDPSKKERLATVIYNFLESLRIIAVLIYPFMPQTALKIWEQLGIGEDMAKRGFASITSWGGIRPGTRIKRLPPLFPRVEIKERAVVQGLNFKEKEGKEMIEIGDFQRLDLRVGEIISVDRVEGADKLYKLEVNLGTEKRTIVAGIAQNYGKEELLGKKIILVANLKPVKIRGILSEGMLLAAQEGDRLSIVTLDRDIANGAKVK